MQFEELKQEILKNEFVDRLRSESVIDGAAFKELCRHVGALALFWQQAALIDKELIFDLYVQVIMLLYQVFDSHYSNQERDQLFLMYAELDDLLQKCLSNA